MIDQSEMTVCTNCGERTALETTVTRRMRHRGRPYDVELLMTECSNCGHDFVTGQQAKLNDARAVDARAEALSALAPQLIRRVRESLRWTQQRAGELLGGGPNAFAKYEAGAVAPSKPMDVLLRILGRHPEIAAELSGEQVAAEPKSASTSRDLNQGQPVYLHPQSEAAQVVYQTSLENLIVADVREVTIAAAVDSYLATNVLTVTATTGTAASYQLDMPGTGTQSTGWIRLPDRSLVDLRTQVTVPWERRHG